MPASKDPTLRFFDSVAFDGSCLIWLGQPNAKGYGVIRVYDKVKRVHRWAYETFIGPIPEGMQIDHICRVRLCTRPEHLRLTTNKQNSENRTVRAGNQSGHRGVSWNRRLGKWNARYCHNGVDIWVGAFVDLEDAVQAVTSERLRHFTHNEEDRKVS